MKNVKNWLFCAVVTANGFAQASTITCEGGRYQAKVPTNTSSEQFELVEKKTGKSLSGICERDGLAIEISTYCFITTSTDSGYELKIVSTGGLNSFGTLVKWSMGQSSTVDEMNCSYQPTNQMEAL